MKDADFLATTHFISCGASDLVVASTRKQSDFIWVQAKEGVDEVLVAKASYAICGSKGGCYSVDEMLKEVGGAQSVELQ
jgi:hypothetical protein